MSETKVIKVPIVDIGDENIAILIRDMIVISNGVKEGKRQILDRRYVNFCEIALEEYLKLPWNHWINDKYPDSQLVVEAYRTIENEFAKQQLKIIL